jgi:hypothetical protein
MRHTSPARLRPYERLHIVPVTLRIARAYVMAIHRHLGAPAGGKLAIAVADPRGHVRGVAILGRPIARKLDTGTTVEVTRVATDGCPNACSALYGAARRVARELGYQQVLTYTRADEAGTSLRAAGWTAVYATRGGTWHRAARPRRNGASEGVKVRWSASASGAAHRTAA